MTPAALADRLEAVHARAANAPVTVGFDAFIDQVQEVVDTRVSAESYRPLETIAAFSSWAAGAAGRSGLRETVTTARAMGGCAVNSGDGLAALGFPVTALAGVGEAMDPLFAPFRDVCRSLDPLGMEPGRSTVYEFRDGKLMLCETAHLARLSPALLEQPDLAERLRRSFARAAGILLTAWSVYPHMTACWRTLQRGALAGLGRRPRLLIDLADPAGRTPADLEAMAETLAGFETIGPTSLSLNGNEANRLARVLGLAPADLDRRTAVEELAQALRGRLALDEVGIHTVHTATAATAAGALTVDGPHCARPRRSVGAGDRFNAGWLAGHLLELPDAGRLLLACAVSGAFVRSAQSPRADDLIAFLRRWAAGTLDQPESP
jgi:hypothetical protein